MKSALLLLLSLPLLVRAADPARPSQSEPAWRAQGLQSFELAWQTVDETFYDPTFGGFDWRAVHDELRPRAEAAPTPEALRRVIADMLSRLKRSHFALVSSADVDGPMGEATLPIDVRVRSDGVLITGVDAGSPADRAGVKAGQRLLAVDDLDMTGWRADGPGRPARDAWRKVQRAIHGPLGTPVALTVSTPDGPRRVSLIRSLEPGVSISVGNLPRLAVRTDVRQLKTPKGRNAGLIGFNLWMPAIDASVGSAVDRFRRADGIVLDLRGNPGGLAAMMSGIAGHFVADQGALLGRMQTRQGQLEFHPNPRTVTADGRRVRPYAGPVAILVDELTGSTSECFAGALQGLGRARVFGQLTMGEALPALTKQLPNGDVMMYAVGNFVTSAGQSLEGGGVVPDEAVALVPDALATGRDLVVEAALRWFDAGAPATGNRLPR